MSEYKWRPWADECPNCGSGSEVYTDSGIDYYAYDSSPVRCADESCGFKGLVSGDPEGFATDWPAVEGATITYKTDTHAGLIEVEAKGEKFTRLHLKQHETGNEITITDHSLIEMIHSGLQLAWEDMV